MNANSANTAESIYIDSRKAMQSLGMDYVDRPLDQINVDVMAVNNNLYAAQQSNGFSNQGFDD